MPKRYFKGVHPRGFKELTEDLPIVEMNAPAKLYLPVEAKDEPKLFVDVGDRVNVGMLVARGNVNVFASCSGVVCEITKRRVINGSYKTHIIIENDFEGTSVTLPKLANPSKDEIIERITYAGITGMSGSGFPTGRKLSTDKKIDYVIINGCECEPYINCDNSIMIAYPEKVLAGAALLRDAVGAKTAIIAIEDNKPKAIERIKSSLSSFDNIELSVLKTEYPQGDARRLVSSVLGIRISQKVRTTDCGVIVNNVQTAYASYRAIKEGIPSYSRIITVSGGGIKSPANLRVPHGTLFTDIIEFCGGCDENNTVRLICGGAMMGNALLDSKYSTSNTTSSLLLLTPPETIVRNSSACINCAKCAKVCPAKIMPMYIDLYARVENFDMAERYGAEYCIECGCCAYVCPAKRTLVTSMKQAKSAIAAKKKKEGGSK